MIICLCEMHLRVPGRANSSSPSRQRVRACDRIGNCRAMRPKGKGVDHHHFTRGPFIMCDYSLESTARRDAVAGDQLKTARIGMHATVGLIARDEPDTAVCLVPGTRLILSAIPRDL